MLRRASIVIGLVLAAFLAAEGKDDSPEEVLNHELEHDNPYLPQNAPGSWYMFNNQSAEQVLNQLEELYQVQIVFDKKELLAP